MTSEIRCAFCTGFVRVDLTGRYPGRTTTCSTLKCPHCDSTFVVEVKTLRKSKGKRLRGFEAKAKANHDALAAQYEIANEEVARQLLAEPGCTCATEAAIRSADTYHDRRRPDAPDGLTKGGVGKRDGHNGMPYPPRHRYHCPARKGGDS
jgi:hypothetical protein